jgi:HupE/UreJ protein
MMRITFRQQTERGAGGGVAILLALCVLGSAVASAHGVSSKDARYLLSLDGPAIMPLMYLGAKHMVTGYDHLLFLVGVIFFLYRLKDILLYVSLFTIGHSLTLLGGALGGVRANAYLVDAVIGLSIVYKAFENMGGFKALGFHPNTRAAVLMFGLVHGFGLATKLQEYSLSRNGLVTNIVSFNGGVEIGQFLALSGVLLALGYWRTRAGYLRHAYAANAALMTAGFVLAGYQLTGYFMAAR